MTEKAKDVLDYVKPRKILIPVAIGLAVASYLLISNFDRDAFRNISWTWYSTFWIIMAIMMVVVRDLSYMYRIRILTDNELSWRRSFDVIMLWEFASAVAPAALGGGFAFAILILNRERITMGRSISVIMFTSFLDGMFFALIAPLVYFIAGKERLFSSIDSENLQQLSHGQGLLYTFWTIYFIVLAYKIFVAYALFINARAVKSWLIKLFSLRYLRRWRYKVLITGTELVIAANELKKQKGGYWLKSFLATCASWSARFIIINCIIMAFSNHSLDHFLLYARQVVMGIIMIGSPTPGGTGVAEVVFSNFLGEFIDNAALTASLAFLWRLISYYPYLFVGAIVLPRWVKRVFRKEEIETT
jgi:glycosyltransferase 2 family protein